MARSARLLPNLPLYVSMPNRVLGFLWRERADREEIEAGFNA